LSQGRLEAAKPTIQSFVPRLEFHVESGFRGDQFMVAPWGVLGTAGGSACPSAVARQPVGVGWPAGSVTASDVDARVDRATFRAFAGLCVQRSAARRSRRTNAVVVVQQALVAERYREGVDPDRAFISWSMAKSITSCLIGILVKQDRLDISRPISVKEWSADDKRRRISIDQMRDDGLRFREASTADSGLRYYPEDDQASLRAVRHGQGRCRRICFHSSLRGRA
jgi:CubicO group peptidase (beta-lactamase class C family)